MGQDRQIKRVAVCQRVARDPKHGERRDCLDQRWFEFLAEVPLIPVLIPNHLSQAQALLQTVAVDGVLLTGGNSIPATGGGVPERDEVEQFLFESALKANLPILGVCRGMQVIQSRRGVELKEVEGHVQPTQEIEIDGVKTVVNSYHDWGATDSSKELEVWARSEDGIVKAVRCQSEKSVGIMWHPERMAPFRPADLALFRDIFLK